MYTFSPFLLIPYFDLFLKLKWMAVFLKWHFGTKYGGSCLSFIVFSLFFFFFLLSRTILSENTCRALCVRWWSLSLQKNDTDLTAILFVSQCPLGLIHRGKFCVLGASPGRVLKKICLHLVVEAFCFDYFLVAFNHISRSEYLFRDEVLEWKLFLAGYALFLKVIVSESLSCKIISNVLIKVFSFWTWRAI